MSDDFTDDERAVLNIKRSKKLPCSVRNDDDLQMTRFRDAESLACAVCGADDVRTCGCVVLPTVGKKKVRR